MKIFRILVLIIASIIALNATVLSSANEDNNEESINTNIQLNNENTASQSVIARVYVQPPNFIVLDEEDSKIMTIIKDADVPPSYNGTLIKVRTKDLSHIEKVLVNLNIDEIIVYQDDIEIAEELIKSGFNVVLK